MFPWGVPERRRGLLVRGGADERVSASRHHLLDRLHARERTTKRAMRASLPQRLDANHFEEIVEPHAIDLVPKLAWHYDEPFADSSAVPTYYVSKVARRACDGRALGRRRRRELRRLPPLQADHVGRPAALVRSRRRCGATCSGRLGHVYPKLGWAPRVLPLQIDFPEPEPRFPDRGLLSTGFRAARRR